MDYGICTLAIIPMRADPSEKSEMVSQLLFGEPYTVVETAAKWIKVSSAYDNYEGWISANQHTISAEGSYNLQLQKSKPTSVSFTTVTKSIDGSNFYIPFGSFLQEAGNGTFTIGDVNYTVNLASSPDFDITSLAKTFINVPYLWGGRTHFGIDCSGFVQAVFRQVGVNLKRDAYLQAEEGIIVHFLQEVQPGDVAFFDNDEGRIIHVGIMIDQEKIIHASGRVKIEHIDSQGIYSDELKRYTHKLRIIKRFV